MLHIPTKYALVSAFAEGGTTLNAFDNALLRANVANVNLARLSSILPPRAEYQKEFEFPAGALLPIVYTSISSSTPGELIAAAIGVGISSPDQFGVIMEFSGRCSQEHAEQMVTRMVTEAFEMREMALNEVITEAVEHRVEQIGCVFVGVPLFD